MFCHRSPYSEHTRKNTSGFFPTFRTPPPPLPPSPRMSRCWSKSRKRFKVVCNCRTTFCMHCFGRTQARARPRRNSKLSGKKKKNGWVCGRVCTCVCVCVRSCMYRTSKSSAIEGEGCACAQAKKKASTQFEDPSTLSQVPTGRKKVRMGRWDRCWEESQNGRRSPIPASLLLAPVPDLGNAQRVSCFYARQTLSCYAPTHSVCTYVCRTWCFWRRISRGCPKTSQK